MTSSRIAHAIVLAGGLALIAWLPACVPSLTGAPCHSEANCLEGQSCVGGLCVASGSNGGGDGSVQGDGGRDGGGTGGGAGSTDAGPHKDGGSSVGKDGGAGSHDAGAGPVFDGGTGESNMGSCFDGLDNDGDGKIDCADSDCVAQACRPPVGECDVVELCVAGLNSCPSDTLATTNTTCGPAASCADGKIQPQSFCNSSGGCMLKSGLSCNGYQCSGSVCVSACMGDSDCDSTHYCMNTTCVLKIAQGGNCTAGNQCATGNCADGTCCNSACTGDCDSCATASGQCSHAPRGADPKARCGAGICDGNGACSTACVSPPVCGNSGCKASAVCLGTQCSDLKPDNSGCADPCECKSAMCTKYSPDADSDGYGSNTAAPIGFCGGAVTRPGYSTNALDTCDKDKNVYPGNTTFYASANQCGTYDYDCDGVETKETLTFSCPGLNRCRNGYAADVACGASALFGTCPLIAPANCSPMSTTPNYVERCR